MRARSDDAGPMDPVFQPSDLVEKILGALEAAGCPASINDQIVELIELWESEVARQGPPPAAGDEIPF